MSTIEIVNNEGLVVETASTQIEAFRVIDALDRRNLAQAPHIIFTPAAAPTKRGFFARLFG